MGKSTFSESDFSEKSAENILPWKLESSARAGWHGRSPNRHPHRRQIEQKLYLGPEIGRAGPYPATTRLKFPADPSPKKKKNKKLPPSGQN